MAILGSDTFDVNEVDLASVQLEGVAPLRSNIEDVATPFEGELLDCSSCTTDGPDGHVDVTLKFRNAEILAALGDIQDDECKELTLTGSLLDGTPFKGKDKVKIVPKGPKGTVETLCGDKDKEACKAADPHCNWNKKEKNCGDSEAVVDLSSKVEGADVKEQPGSTGYTFAAVSAWALLVPMLMLLSQLLL